MARLLELTDLVSRSRRSLSRRLPLRDPGPARCTPQIFPEALHGRGRPLQQLPGGRPVTQDALAGVHVSRRRPRSAGRHRPAAAFTPRGVSAAPLGSPARRSSAAWNGPPAGVACARPGIRLPEGKRSGENAQLTL